MPAVQETVEQVRKIDVDQYKYGFQTEIETDKAPKGLSEDIIRFISATDEMGQIQEELALIPGDDSLERCQITLYHPGDDCFVGKSFRLRLWLDF